MRSIATEGVQVFIDLDDEQAALRDELKAYYAELMNPDVRREMEHEEGTGPIRRRIVEQLGTDGWIAMGWPEEYGGQGKSAVE